ncbi:MAG: hypothetical protein M1455_11020 [Actinobacteria bacterium]|nr:hypothetical protein [Actinomycetota bacterium]
MDSLACPYCGQQKHDEAVDFASCHICGLKSALVPSGDSMLLIVDRRMPYLKRRCNEIAEMNPAFKVIVDRRINQDPHEEPDRRIAAPAELISDSETDYTVTS